MKTFKQFIEEFSPEELSDDILKVVKLAYSSDKDKFINLLRSLNNIEIIEILDDMNRNNLNSIKQPSKHSNDSIIPNNADSFE